MSVLDYFKEKKPDNIDSPETTIRHREIILNKKFLKNLYTEWYYSFIKITKNLPSGHLIEIGSGGGFLKQIDPSIITSDILKLPDCDMVFSAEKMPFEDKSVSAIFMIDVLHHIPDSKLFFAEAQRVLNTGGIIFMIEPANTFFSRIIFKNIHHEPFNTEVTEWKFPASGPLSGANGALPWIIFKRDIKIFEELYPYLSLKKIKYHTPFRYLITGGLSYKSLVPGWAFKPVTFFEKLLTPLFPIIALFQTIQIIKTKHE